MIFKAAILLLALLSGCTPSSPQQAEAVPSPRMSTVLGNMVLVPEWKEPDRYEFDLKSSCGERSLIGRFHVVVTNGVVSRARALDERGRTFLTYAEGHGENVPSMQELLQEADGARSDDADVVKVAVDENDGHPTSIDIDHNEQAIDDEACYLITDYMELIECDGLCISDATVSADQVVTIAFAPPKKQIWGISAEIRLDGAPKPVAWLTGSQQDRTFTTAWPSPNLGFVDIGFYGRGDWTWTVPTRLEPGSYEIRKTSVRGGSAPIEERIRSWTVSFKVTG